jgi:hypothetical protein
MLPSVAPFSHPRSTCSLFEIFKQCLHMEDASKDRMVDAMCERGCAHISEERRLPKVIKPRNRIRMSVEYA